MHERIGVGAGGFAGCKNVAQAGADRGFDGQRADFDAGESTGCGGAFSHAAEIADDLDAEVAQGRAVGFGQFVQRGRAEHKATAHGAAGCWPAAKVAHIAGAFKRQGDWKLVQCQFRRPWQCLYFLPDPQGHGALRGVPFQVAGSEGSTASATIGWAATRTEARVATSPSSSAP